MLQSSSPVNPSVWDITIKYHRFGVHVFWRGIPWHLLKHIFSIDQVKGAQNWMWGQTHLWVPRPVFPPHWCCQAKCCQKAIFPLFFFIWKEKISLCLNFSEWCREIEASSRDAHKLFFSVWWETINRNCTLKDNLLTYRVSFMVGGWSPSRKVGLCLKNVIYTDTLQRQTTKIKLSISSVLLHREKLYWRQYNRNRLFKSSHFTFTV